jgi:hypothetical protein
VQQKCFPTSSGTFAKGSFFRSSSDGELAALVETVIASSSRHGVVSRSSTNKAKADHKRVRELPSARPPGTSESHQRGSVETVKLREGIDARYYP